MVMLMERIRVEQQGRVIIPKQLRDRLGIRAGQHLLISQTQGKLVLQPEAALQQVAAVLKGCVHGSPIKPLEAKRIWRM
jgi:AbrB family looped-hinge helix DNA binding protein